MIKTKYVRPCGKVYPITPRDGILEEQSWKPGPGQEVRSVTPNNESEEPDTTPWGNVWLLFLPLLFSAFLGSCKSDDEAVANLNGVMVNLSMEPYTVEDCIGEEDETRTATPHRLKYQDKGNTVSISWEGQTSIGVFPVAPQVNSQIRFDFRAETQPDMSTSFSGMGWGLLPNNTYAAYYPYTPLSSDMRFDSIPITFTNQTQVGDKSFDHIGSHCDYMYAKATVPTEGAANFKFIHVNTLLKFEVTTPVAAEWESLSLVNRDGKEVFVDSAYMNVATGKITPTHRSSSIRLGLQDVASSQAGDVLSLYLSVLPTNTGRLTVVLRSKEGGEFYANYGAFELKAGRCIRYKTNAGTSKLGSVDLGLPSKTLWATCNLGAVLPEEAGLYLAWGDAEQRERYFWDTYRFSLLADGSHGTSNSHLNAYTREDGYLNANWYDKDGRFCGDNQTSLLPADDVAHLIWGGTWVMPTRQDFEELMASTTCRWDTLESGVMGYTLTSKYNGAELFFPAAGYRAVQTISDTDYDVLGLNQGGYYWSATLSSNYSFDAVEYKFGIQPTSKVPIHLTPSLTDAKRYIGCTIRPVKPKEN